jgi:hypothetical protein
MTVSLLRFKDGLDVISFIETDELLGTVTLNYPMMFELRGNKMVLEHWLPIGIMQSPSATVYEENILCMMEPTDIFKGYYEKTIAELELIVKKESESDTKDPLCDIMYSCFDDLDTNLIH